MLSSLSRSLRLAMMLALGVGCVAWEGHHHVAAAGNADASSDDESSDDGGGTDDPEDKGATEDEDPDDDPTQVPVTSGGLYTLKTYPVRENSRPLTITEKIGQLRLALGTDISAKGAFATGGVSLEGIYGVHDNFSVIGGFTNAYNMKQFGVYAGFEGALIYDLVDIRVAANLHRNAIAIYSNYCAPVSSADPANPTDPMQCAASMASIVNLPNGHYDAGDMKFSVDIGFPFRYAVRPEIAIVALQTLMTVDFNSNKRDHTIQETTTVPAATMDNPNATRDVITNVPVGNKVKPDLNPSIGIATNPIPPLSITIFAQLRIPDFDTSAGAFQVPVTGRAEFSPNQKLDIGLEFTLLNVKPPAGQSPIDNRFISLFIQSRFGR